MNVAIIAAAGSGTRMGGAPKQFRELAGIPIIIHTLRRFEQAASIGEIIVVVPANGRAQFINLAGQHKLGKLSRIVSGGASRAESVWRGLEAVRPATAEVVAVHDGARPFVTAAEIDKTVHAAQESGAAILSTPAVDTIKEVETGIVVRTLERACVRHALTPQCFHYSLLRRAYEQSLQENMDATDDSAIVERLGVKISVVDGDSRNIKITQPLDLMLAEILLREFEE